MARKLYAVGVVILGWFVANLLGVAAIGALSRIPYLTSIPGMLVSSVIIGLPIGFTQWIALRRVAPVSIFMGLHYFRWSGLGIGGHSNNWQNLGIS